MKIRSLNEEGLAKFEEYVLTLRDGAKTDIPSWMLDDDKTSESIGLDIDLENRSFPTRFELGEYLVELLNAHDIQSLIGDRGFWSWIALHLFDQFCPDLGGGKRNAQMPYSYVLSMNWKHRPRHAVFTTWQLVDRFGANSRFLLSRELPVRGEIIEQLMARQYFFGCTSVIALASTLYWDEARKTFKKGAAARKSAGCVTRFVSWLQQLEVNYDLYSLSEKDLTAILPSEFARFRE